MRTTLLHRVGRTVKRCLIPVSIVGVGLLRVDVAHAHLVSTDLGPFYDGAAHPLVSPEDLLTLLGFAILAGFAGPRAGRRMLTTLTVSWVLGVLVGYGLAQSAWDVSWGTASVILLLGLAGAFRLRCPVDVLVWAAAIIGLGHGWMNGAAVHAADGPWRAVLGLTTGVFLLGTLLTGTSTWLQKKRADVLLRVVASWVAAIGLLMLGWQLRG